MRDARVTAEFAGCSRALFSSLAERAGAHGQRQPRAKEVQPSLRDISPIRCEISMGSLVIWHRRRQKYSIICCLY